MSKTLRDKEKQKNKLQIKRSRASKKKTYYAFGFLVGDYS